MSRLLPRACMGLALVASGFGFVHAAEPPPKAKKILFFTKCSDFEHNVVKERDGRPSFAAQVLKELGSKHGIEFTFSRDGSRFAPEFLAPFDAVFFYTSGDLLSAGKDGNPPMTPAGKQALLDAIKGGKGFIGTHSAADTFHTGETAETDTHQARTWRYVQLGDRADPYTQMLGGELIIHGIQHIATVRVIDSGFPGLAGRGDSFEFQEEWYSMRNFAPDLHVLLVLDTGRMRNPYASSADWPPAGWNTPYQRPPYPVAWAHLYGKGRVFYTALGHGEPTWRDPAFHELLLGGMDWALGRVATPVAPNLAQAAPRSAELPPVSAPVSGLPKALKDQEGQTPYHTFP